MKSIKLIFVFLVNVLKFEFMLFFALDDLLNQIL